MVMGLHDRQSEDNDPKLRGGDRVAPQSRPTCWEIQQRAGDQTGFAGEDLLRGGGGWGAAGRGLRTRVDTRGFHREEVARR